MVKPYSMNMERVEFLLTVSEIRGIGKKRAYELCSSFYVPSIDLLEIAKVIGKRYPKINVGELQLIDANQKAREIMSECKESNIHIIDFTHELFSKKLNNLKNPPILLYYKGQIDRLLQHPSVAIIGTREPSDYGKLIAQKFTEYFVMKEINIISGLAKGIDGISQKKVTELNGFTFAILAQGLNTEVYPKENKKLADEIIKKGGALISEYSPDTKPNRNTFVERDRLQSGMSESLIVIESDIDGGSMHAINTMIDLRRKVGALNHPPKFITNNPKSNANQRLINDGSAVPLFDLKSLEDFSSEINRLFRHRYEGSRGNLASEQDYVNSISQNIVDNTPDPNIMSNNDLHISSPKQLGFEDDLFRNE